MNTAALKTAALESLGVPGVVGIGLLLYALAFHLGTLAPARAELARIEADQARLSAAAANAGSAAVAPAAAALPSLTQAPELLKRLNALAAAHGVTVERASYRLKGQEGPRRLEVELPLKVAYPALRGFLRDALRLAPTAALDELSLQRAHAAEPAVDAQLRLSFGFSAAP